MRQCIKRFVVTFKITYFSTIFSIIFAIRLFLLNNCRPLRRIFFTFRYRCTCMNSNRNLNLMSKPATLNCCSLLRSKHCLL